MSQSTPDVHDHTVEIHEHDRGLSHDLPTLLSRRRILTLLGSGAGVAVLSACGAAAMNSSSGSTSASSAASSTAGSSSSTASGEVIPEETGGPYPADGSNGVNVLTESGVVRSDITTSFGSASGVAEGVPLTINLRVLDTKNGSAGLAGAAIYVWHCNIDGAYSLYDEGIEEENYLRGVQETNSDGRLSFTSIYPAAYSGRWPHIHFEVYPSLDAATTASSKLRTSQLALPEDTSVLVYATDGYSQSVRNLEQTSLESDMVFSDGYSLQLATVTGDVDAGMVATLDIPV